ncbi:hypothetical protein FHG87_023489 [Trinorchestia longiramus]|nr:hypothetical protein FHG87_023489 [Trinorchestia longiramus]
MGGKSKEIGKKRKADDEGLEEGGDVPMAVPEATGQLESVTKNRVKGPSGRRMPQHRRTHLMKHRASSLSALAHTTADVSNPDNPTNRSALVLPSHRPSPDPRSISTDDTCGRLSASLPDDQSRSSCSSSKVMEDKAGLTPMQNGIDKTTRVITNEEDVITKESIMDRQDVGEDAGNDIKIQTDTEDESKHMTVGDITNGDVLTQKNGDHNVAEPCTDIIPGSTALNGLAVEAADKTTKNLDLGVEESNDVCILELTPNELVTKSCNDCLACKLCTKCQLEIGCCTNKADENSSSSTDETKSSQADDGALSNEGTDLDDVGTNETNSAANNRSVAGTKSSPKSTEAVKEKKPASNEPEADKAKKRLSAADADKDVENKENNKDWTAPQERKSKSSDSSSRRRKSGAGGRTTDDESLDTDNSKNFYSLGRKKPEVDPTPTGSLGRKPNPNTTKLVAAASEEKQGTKMGGKSKEIGKKRKADDEGLEEGGDVPMAVPEATGQLESVTKNRVKGPSGRRMPQHRRTHLMKHRASSLSALAHTTADVVTPNPPEVKNYSSDLIHTKNIEEISKSVDSHESPCPSMQIETVEMDTFDDIDAALFFRPPTMYGTPDENGNEGGSLNIKKDKSGKLKSKRQVTLDDNGCTKAKDRTPTDAKSKISRFRKTLTSFRRVRLKSEGNLVDDHPDECRSARKTFCSIL